MRNHQKKAKYCIKLQNIKPEHIYKCVCDKEYTYKNRYDNHIIKCKVLIDKEERKKNDENNKRNDKAIDVLMTVVNKLIAAKSTNTTNINNINNGIVNNLIPLDPNYMREQSKFLTQSHIDDGAHGIAQYAKDHVFKNRVICTDASRKVLMYKGLDNKPKIDIKGMNILKELGISIVDINSKLCNEKKLKLEKQLESDYETISKKWKTVINLIEK